MSPRWSGHTGGGRWFGALDPPIHSWAPPRFLRLELGYPVFLHKEKKWGCSQQHICYHQRWLSESSSLKCQEGRYSCPGWPLRPPSPCPPLWAPCPGGQGSIRACGMAALAPVEAREAPLWFGALPHRSETQCPCLQNGDTALHQCGQLTGATPWPPWLHSSTSLPRLGREQPWSLLFIDSRSSP